MKETQQIIEGFTVDELDASREKRQAIRACAQLMTSVSVDFATATTLAALLLAYFGSLAPSAAFCSEHPENDPAHYSSEVVYAAFFLLYLCEKARSLRDISAEWGSCAAFVPLSPNDADTCDGCRARGVAPVPITQAAYANVPPYHVGCRCRPLLLKESDPHAASRS